MRVLLADLLCTAWINILAQYDRFSFRHNYASSWMAPSSFR